MGLPTVFFVALLAAIGFWWTLHAPDQTGNLAASSDELSIRRGCHLDSTDLCAAPAVPLQPVGAVTASSTLCRKAVADGYVHVWRDESGRLGLNWNMPDIANAVYPLSSHWVVAWAGSPEGASFHASAERSGWALLPDSFRGAEITAWAGVTSMGGELEEGLRSVRVVPFGAHPDGTVRLAAHVNDDAIVLEVPATGTFDLVRANEELRFSEWTTGRLPCPSA